MLSDVFSLVGLLFTIFMVMCAVRKVDLITIIKIIRAGFEV